MEPESHMLWTHDELQARLNSVRKMTTEIEFFHLTPGFRFGRRPFSHLLTDGCHSFIISLRLVDGKSGALVNGLPVPLTNCYQDSQVGFGGMSPTEWKCRRAIVLTIKCVCASSLSMTVIATASIWLTRKRKVTVCLRFVFHISIYPSAAHRPHRGHPLAKILSSTLML